MSSASWPEPAPAADLGLELALLCDALDVLTGGAFIFVICEEGALRQRLMRHVHDHLQGEGGRDLIEIELSPEQPDLAGQLGQQLLYDQPEEVPAPAKAEVERVRDRSRPPVIFVRTRGLADAWMDVDHLPEDDPDRVRAESARRALRALNFQRERLSRLNVPLVFWLSQNTLGQVMQHAADVFAARSGLFYFEYMLPPFTEPTELFGMYDISELMKEKGRPLRIEAAVDLLDRFHRTLLPPEELRKRAALYEQRLERMRSADQPNWPGVALLCRDLAYIHHEMDDHEREDKFQEQAIKAYQRAIAELEPKTGDSDKKEQEWATLQFWLGLAYYERRREDRAANLEQAIQCYRQALRVYTPEAAPLQYAMTQNNLGNAYLRLPTGDRVANLEQAIQCYRQALRFWTPEAAPLDYATTQNNLGLAYAGLPTGDRVANLEQAIQCYRQALRFRTLEAAPLKYAMTQNNLGLAYAGLPTGDRAVNLEQAIQCYHQALRFRTPEAAPLEFAGTQNNLGNAYLRLPTGDRAANLEQAIQCYRQALRFRTPEAAPLEFAGTQNNLGNAYLRLPTGDRAANLEQAIQCYRQALAIEHLPSGSQARYLRNLGDVHSELEDHPAAIAAYKQAIDLTPDNPWLFNVLGSIYSRQKQHEQAIEAYTAALAVATADEIRALLHRNRASSLVHLDRLDEAEQDCERARALAPDHPYTHARLGQLAFARGDYAAAVEHYTAAIERQEEPGFYFDRGLAHLALGHPDQALADYKRALPLADATSTAEALEELEEFAADHPDTPGLDAVRALSPPSA